MHAVTRNGPRFTVQNPEKLLYLWATYRKIKNDLIYQVKSPLPPKSMESLMPPGTVFAAFSAWRFLFPHQAPPADYDHIYVYSSSPQEIKKRFPPKRGTPNLFVLQPDPFLKRYGQATCLSQTFADLWNLPEWYAGPYLQNLQEKIHGILA